ncbi:hypothetical protein FDG2_2879 [Candidatus Protofrankia californiensis]|uniref:SnoaL-like domain-containing protein n=1 Tax=Candidatus Protofrankia californiensis TaxID=1839754 RepID=A0A1C3NYK0_9ACTN|nr:hypothetical protein FDG2_2879 [Candidatus Protofrankia californiensis]
MAPTRSATRVPVPVGAGTYVEIHGLYARQAQSMDLGDAETFTATFTEDAVFTHISSGEVLRGRAAIAEALLRTAERRRGAVHRHWFNQLVLDASGEDGAADGQGAAGPVDGPGSVTARYYAIVSATGADGTVRWDPSCVVEDVLVRGAGGWLTRFRTVRRDDLLLR